MAQVAQPNQPMTDQQRKALASVTPPKNAKDQRASTQNHLMFSEIRDNIVIMRDGSLRMVVMASPLNFDLKSAREQDAIEYAYQGFLYGLHFPVQIIVRSRKIDLENYLTKLETLQAEQENQLLAGLMEDYIYNIRGLLEDVNIMSKHFFVVVPYYVQAVTKDNIVSKIGGLLKPSEDVVQTSADYETHKKDLVQRTSIVAQGLAQMGVRAAVLTTQELVELYYGSYNIEEAQNQPLADTNDLNTPIVERRGPNPVPHGHEQRAAEPEDMFAAAKRATVPTMHQPGVVQQAPQAAAQQPVAQPQQTQPQAQPQAAAPTQPAPAAPQPLPQQPIAPIAPAQPQVQPAVPTNQAQPGQTVQIPKPQNPTQPGGQQ